MNRLDTCALVLFLLAFSSVSYSQSRQVTEVTLGLGATYPSEMSPLNIPGDPPMPSSFALNMSIRWPVADLVFVGLRGFGTINKRSGYTVTSSTGTIEENASFRLTTYNLAADGILLLSKKSDITPYVLGMICYTGGIIADNRAASLKHQGYCFGGGGGIRLALSKTVALCLEGFFTSGRSYWEEPPASNASGTEYDPSTIILLANFSFVVG